MHASWCHMNLMICKDFESRRVEAKFYGDAYARAFVDRPSSVKREATSHSSLNAIAAAYRRENVYFQSTFTANGRDAHIHNVHMYVSRRFRNARFHPARNRRMENNVCSRYPHAAYSFNRKSGTIGLIR